MGRVADDVGDHAGTDRDELHPVLGCGAHPCRFVLAREQALALREHERACGHAGGRQRSRHAFARSLLRVCIHHQEHTRPVLRADVLAKPLERVLRNNDRRRELLAQLCP